MDPFEHFRWDDAQALQHVIGSNPVSLTPACDVGEESAVNTKMNVVRAYVLGELRYTDANGTAHVTQLARQIVVEQESFTDFKALTKPVGPHNCTEDCPRS